MSSIDALSLWNTALLSDIAGINPPRIQPADASVQFDFVPMQSVGEELSGIQLSQKRTYQEVSKGYTQFLSDDILFAKITPCMENGKIAIVPELSSECGYGSTEFHVVRPHHNVSNRLVAYYLAQHSVRRDAQRNMTGSAGQLRVPTRWFEHLQLPLPPAAQQHRIVAKIDELFSDLDAGVAALERAKAKLKRYRASVLKAAVEGRLTEDWRKANPPQETGEQLLARILQERRDNWEKDQLAKFKAKGQKPPKDWREKYVEPVKPDVSALPGLPEGWCWATMGQCFTVSVGATPSRKEPSYWNGSIPWVSSGEVQFGRIKHTREHITESGFKNSSTRVNPIGSVILGMIGEGKTRGQSAILDVESCNNQNCAAIWVSQAGIKPEFIYYWLYGQYEKTRSLGSGNNQPALNKSIVEKMAFPLPPLDEICDIVEQLEIAFSVAAEAEVTVVKSLLRASRLRQSILKHAFEGKLVPQDPNDEPASVLLERIKAERANSAAPVRRGRGRAPKAAASDTTTAAPKRRGRPPKRKDS